VDSEGYASGPSVQVVDVSRASRNVRWIRYGARILVTIAIGFCVLSVDFVLTSIDPNVYSYRVPELRGLAATVFVLALVSAATSLGLLTARPMAAIASLVLFGLPSLIFGATVAAMEAMSASKTKLEEVAAPCILLVPGFCLVVASIRALAYCRNSKKLGTPQGLPRSAFQRRLFQSRGKASLVALFLVLTAVAPFLATVVYAAILLAVPVLLPPSVRPGQYGPETTSQYYAKVLDHPLTFGGACLVALGAGAFFFFRARRYARASAAELRLRDGRAPILFLRSFRDDQIAFRSWLRGTKLTLDEDLADALAIHGPVVAIGRPGETLPPLGSARDYVPDSDWQNHATGLILDAQTIVAVLGATAGIRWEFETVARLNAVSKLLLVVPPVSNEEFNNRWQVVVAVLREFAIIPDSLLFDKVLIVGMDIGGQPFVVTSDTRKEGDYYEAIGKAQCIRQSVTSLGTAAA
jgi:hypothetical protein